MKISVNWVREFTEVNLPIDELARKIGAQLGEVDEVIDLGAKYKGIVIAKVVSCQNHPNADKLHVCKIDDGGVINDIQRDENGYVQIVCGAPNVREGLLVAWLPPRSTVPSTFDKDPFVLEVRELRGVASNGMLASAHELAIGDDHNGIMELDQGEPGQDFAEVFELNDHIIDVENKMFTHRPDCFGQLGIAREIAGIQHQAFKSPDWYLHFNADTLGSEADLLPLEVKNELPDLVPRFSAIALSGVQVKPSPIWLQTYLTAVGIRPINNVVDLTNYYTMLTGQPLHAYDYDKLKMLDSSGHATITVRYPHEGEKITLLGGKEITPRQQAIMIASASKLIGVGGVMGGIETEVDVSTKNIVLECATFDLYSIRRTSMEHGLFTEAVTRFSKGQSPLQNDRVVAQIVEDLRKIAKGKIASNFIDIKHNLSEPPQVTVTAQFINERLGLHLSSEKITTLLQNVEFAVQLHDDNLVITVPFWRTDIHIAEDMVEEVGRLYGYDHLPLELPQRDLTPPPKDWLFELKKQIRDNLSAAGANELLTYTFVHGNLLDKVGQNRDQAFQISNALSPDLQYYRLSLTPSLLDKVHSNLRADYVRSDDNEFALFELNKVHNQQEKQSDQGLPKEMNSLALVFAADDKTATRKHSGAPYYQAKQYLSELLADFGVQNYVQFVPLDQADLYDNQWAVQMAAPFEPKRSAVLMDEKGMVWGIVGEYKASVKRALKLPNFTVGFELDVILLKQGQATTYTPLSKFPRTQQDISFKLPATTIYQQLFDAVWQELSAAQEQYGYVPTLGPVDIYQPAEGTAYKNITLRIWLYHPDRTLTTDEVNKLLDQIAAQAQQRLGAVRL